MNVSRFARFFLHSRRRARAARWRARSAPRRAVGKRQMRKRCRHASCAFELRDGVNRDSPIENVAASSPILVIRQLALGIAAVQLKGERAVDAEIRG